MPRIHRVTTHVKADNQFQPSAATCWSTPYPESTRVQLSGVGDGLHDPGIPIDAATDVCV